MRASTLSITGQMIAEIVAPQPKVAQRVYVAKTSFGKSVLGPIYTVLVVPAGSKKGRNWECREGELELLRKGYSPEELELLEVEDE